ncbi:MAG: hypothetical protein ACKKMS_01355 [Candidatus Nealsonbacteria bacterium]
MKKKILTALLVVMLISALGFAGFIGYLKYTEQYNIGLKEGKLSGYEEGYSKGLEMEKIQRLRSLIGSEEFLGGFSIAGKVEEIFEYTLVINEEGEERFLVIPVSQEAEITLGKKEIAFEDIKVGDKVFVLLNSIEVILSDSPLQGVYVSISEARR